MIAKLSGTVVDVRTLSGHIVLDVAGVGYLVAVRTPTDFSIRDSASLYTHLAVRENAMDLYGFLEHDELEMFELLLTLPKIGPKSAMQIMSQADIELLKKSVVSEDPTYLSKMSGIGAKSAEKIVVGLKDKFEYIEATDAGSSTVGDSDVIDALMALGYNQKDARSALQKLPPEITDTNERIKEALKQIGT